LFLAQISSSVFPMPGFSLRNPYLVIAGALIVLLMGSTSLFRMQIDVFPQLDTPAVVVATFYPGMQPADIERFFTLTSGIEHMESRSLPGMSVIKVFFHQGTDPDAAASGLVSLAMADLNHMPPGTLPPTVLKSGAGSLPVVLVTLSGEGLSEAELRDIGLYDLTTKLATVPGASGPPPFGGKIRQIMAYANRQALEARGLTLMSVVQALNSANLILPAGSMNVGDTNYFVQSNNMIETPDKINEVPVKVGVGDQAPVFVSDVGRVEDSAQIQTNVVRINGQRSAYVPVILQGGANTLQVVDGVRALLPTLTDLPKSLKLDVIFDQSAYIRDAIRNLAQEASLASVLATLTILLFLGSLRSAIAVFLAIVLSLMAAVFGLYLGGSTINIMILGGFALAIGRLVDDTVVVIENVNRHLLMGKDPRQAALDGTNEVTFAVLASTLTTVIVFVPVTFLSGVAKFLFTELALAVVLSMLASYVVAMTVAPNFCARFLTAADAAAEGQGGRFGGFIRAYERFAERYTWLLERSLDYKFLVLGTVAALAMWAVFGARHLGTEFFPQTDSGQFLISLRAPVGSRIEITEALTEKLEHVIRGVIPPRDLDVIVANLGLGNGFSAIYSPNAATDSGQLMVSLKDDREGSTFAYVDRLREEFRQRVPEVRTLFQSGGIVDSVLSFGAAAPIDIQLTGSNYQSLSDAAHLIARTAQSLPQVADAFIPQESSYPTLHVEVDRVKAARLGLTQKEVVDNIITALNSNQMIAPSIWIDPKSGNDYFLTAQYAERDIRSLDTLLDIPVRISSHGAQRGNNVLLRNIAAITETRQPAEADHYNIQRVVNVLISPRTEDLGGTQAALQRAVAKLALPEGVKVTFRGTVSAMQESFANFDTGIAMAVLLLYLVMVAQFRSFIDPVIVLLAVPAGLIGVVATLLATDTTLNIQSLMGVIAMIGIVASNAILLVDFANERRRQGVAARRAVVDAARTRMRPILMTSLATILGFLPIALNGHEASAPLARAAGGGLAVSVLLTLFLVPAVYELIYSRRRSEVSL
jgi:multidrug efflux pump subunit AcrB